MGVDPVSLILGIVIFIIFWKLAFKDEKAEIINKLPGPRAYPLVGNILELLEPRDKALDNMLERREKFGSIIRIWQGMIPLVAFSEPEHIEVLIKSSRHTEKADSYRFLHPWLGTGLLTSHGKKWLSHRKLITPTFHFQVLQNFVEVFYENANILVGKLNKKAETREEFDIHPLVTLCALDIICETAMGTKINAQSDSENEYVKSVYSLTNQIMYRISRPWLHPDFIFKRSSAGKEFQEHLRIVQGFAEEVIKGRAEALKNKKTFQADFEPDVKRKLTFLDLLLENSMADTANQLTMEEIREEVDTFMFEGHDTTAAGINWVLYTLGNHPKIQEDVYKEIQEVLKDDIERSPSMNELAEMKLLERVIKEVLRLYPSVTGIGRIIEEDIEIGGFRIPKGTNAFISIYSLHRDPKNFPDPSVFNPDRFLPENSQKRHPYSYLPFSAGPRNCIGQKFAMLEEKVVISTLIRKFKFESVVKQEEMKKIPQLVLRPATGIQMRISRR